MARKLKSYAEWRLGENMAEYDFYYKNYKRLILSMFKWSNLPDGISERFIEETLFDTGLCVIFKCSKGFYVATKGTPIGINNYEEPTGFRCYSNDHSVDEIVKAENCVAIYNDFLREGNVANVHFFAKRISNVEKTIGVNLEQLKHPYIISCPESQKETVKAVLEKKTNGEPYILTSEDFGRNVDVVKVFSLDIQNHVDDLEDVKHEMINQGLTFFGINNVNVIKKERLVTGEADQNNEQIYFNKNSMLKSRLIACNELNAKFNLNISVEITKESEDIS